MSWSVSLIGKPDNIVAALEEESAKLSGQSKVEFDDAKPHLAALVKQTFATEASGYTPPLIHLEAAGSGTTRGAEQLQRSCTVSVKPMWTKLVAAVIAMLALAAGAFADGRPPAFPAAPVFPACPCGDGCKCPPGACEGGACAVKGDSPLDACVGVSCNGGWASGTAIAGAPKGRTWVVTAKHVTDLGGTTVLHQGKTYPFRLIRRHPTADIALVEVDASLPTVRLADARPGDQVTLKGYGGSWAGPQPGAFESPRTGAVSHTGSSSMGVVVQHGPGDSGGGYLVGVLSGGYRGTRNSVGVPASTIREILPAGVASGADEITTETIITPDVTTREVQVIRNPSSNQPDCPNGRCPLPGASSSVSYGGVASSGGSCGGAAAASTPASGSGAVSYGMLRGGQPRLRIFGGPGLVRGFFGGRCR